MSTLRKNHVKFVDKNTPAEHDVDLYRQELENTLNRTKSILKNKNGNVQNFQNTATNNRNFPSTEYLDHKVQEISNSINSLQKFGSNAKVSREIVNASAMKNCCSCDCQGDKASNCEWTKKLEKLKLKNRVLKDKLTESEGKIASLQAQLSLSKTNPIDDKTLPPSHLQKELDKMENLIQELEGSKSKSQDCELLRLLRLELQSKKDLLVKVAKKLKRKKKELIELKEALKELVLKGQITDQRLSELEVNSKRLKKSNHDLKDERERLKALLQASELRIRELEFELSKSQENDELHSKVDLLREKLRGVKLSKEKEKDRFEIQLQDLNEKILWLNNKNMEISSELVAVKAEKEVLARTIPQPQIQVKEVIVEKPVVVEKPVYIEVETPLGIQETREIKISNEFYEEQLSRLRQELSHVTFLFNEKERENLSLKAKLASLTDELHRWRQY